MLVRRVRDLIGRTSLSRLSCEEGKRSDRQIKAVESLIRAHTAQVISYLRALDRPLGLLLNFQVPTLKQGGIKRVVLTELNRARNLIGEILGGLGVLAATGE